MIEWESDRRLIIDGTSFELAVFQENFTGDADFDLQKTRSMVEHYLALEDEFQGSNVFEAGIYRGGSVALLAQVLSPKKMVSIDIRPDSVAALEAHLAARSLDTRVIQEYGVDQSDSAVLGRLLDSHFHEESLDLVVDDASHDLRATIATFNAVFPRVRPGGAYIIEDWSSDLGWERLFRSDPDRYADLLVDLDPTPALSSFVVDLLLAVGYDDSVVAEMSVQNDLVVVRRGDADLVDSKFEINRLRGDLSVVESSRWWRSTS